MIRFGDYKKRIKKLNYKFTSNGLLHRYIWEKVNGYIPKGMVIHHIDGNHLNNNINNLECLTHLEHGQRHKQMRSI